MGDRREKWEPPDGEDDEADETPTTFRLSDQDEEISPGCYRRGGQ